MGFAVQTPTRYLLSVSFVFRAVPFRVDYSNKFFFLVEPIYLIHWRGGGAPRRHEDVLRCGLYSKVLLTRYVVRMPVMLIVHTQFCGPCLIVAHFDYDYC